MGKLTFFCKIWSPFEFKTYLKFHIPKYNRPLITKIRISAHSLAIKTGRYCKPKISANERFCKFCKFCKDQVEDEIHFLLHCPLYKDFRENNSISKI